ncbi:MAG: iron-containing alcohol dehydrogenase [Peptococcaceae bacterium]|nr:iron-containing alcohol dehydrogenase [Peptococcaceae bacterium]
MVHYLTRTSPVLFGAGASDQTGVKVRELGCGKVICITDKGIKNAGIADEVVKNLEAAGIEVVQYDGIMPDPTDWVIEECATVARNESVDGVVAVGGGSVMDAAKGVNILLTNPPPISQYYGVNVPQKAGRALVLLPTTAGTGSEVTCISVVTDSRNNKKVGVIGANCMATLAIVDPALTVKSPPSLTASTGMDVFSHAAEALTSAEANPVSDILAEKAIALTTQYLPLAVKDGTDIKARTHMSLASMIAGIAFNDAKPHLGHAIAHTLGARLHIPHGIACALALPGVIEYVADAVPDKVRSIGRAMGLRLEDGMPAQEVGKEVANAIKTLSASVGIPTMKDLNIEKSSLDAVIPNVLKDDCAFFIPKQTAPDTVAALLYDVYNR